MFPFAGVGVSAHRRLIVVVVVAAVVAVVVVAFVVVESIIILIIVIVDPIDFGWLHLCQTVRLESSFFKTFDFASQSDGPANGAFCCCGRFPMACRVESDFCLPKINSWRGRCPLS